VATRWRNVLSRSIERKRYQRLETKYKKIRERFCCGRTLGCLQLIKRRVPALEAAWRGQDLDPAMQIVDQFMGEQQRCKCERLLVAVVRERDEKNGNLGYLSGLSCRNSLPQGTAVY
jgi:hypothetical protein